MNKKKKNPFPLVVTRVTPLPYKVQYQPRHQRADMLGFVSEHVLVAEDIIGGPLPKGTIVHHKDWNKRNNEETNLEFMARSEHQALPAWQAQFIIEKNLLDEFFQWWRALKNKKDELREMELKLALAEEQQLRNTVKMNKKGR